MKILYKLLVLVLVFVIGYSISDLGYLLSVKNESKINMSIEDSVIMEIKRLNLSHPHIVLAQAQLESGNFTSKIFRKYNNMFGMRIAKSRPTVSRKSQNNWAVYSNWRESLIDYALYQSSYLRNKSESEYFLFLSKNYASDPEYIEKVKSRSNKNKKIFK